MSMLIKSNEDLYLQFIIAVKIALAYRVILF